MSLRILGLRAESTAAAVSCVLVSIMQQEMHIFFLIPEFYSRSGRHFQKKCLLRF